ncbi:MAG: hypothetical protein V3R29_02985 [Candidatus Acidoferrales bacterium]
MRRLFVISGLLLLLAIPARAQKDYPPVELFGGFSLFNFENGRPERFYGFDAAIAANLDKYGGVVFDFAGQFKNVGGVTVQVYEYLLGLQFTARGEAATAFAHTLLGGRSVNNGAEEMSFAMAIGGGLDVNVGKRFAIRVFQIDWVPSLRAGIWSKRDFRASIGVVVKGGGS